MKNRVLYIKRTLKILEERGEELFNYLNIYKDISCSIYEYHIKTALNIIWYIESTFKDP